MQEKSQVNAIHNLIQIKRIFETHDIPYWLDAGTLLCAYRDGDLLHEHDIDLGMFVEDFGRVWELRDAFKRALGSFNLFAFNSAKNPIIISWGANDGSKVRVVHGDLLPWYPVGKCRARWANKVCASVPKEYLSEFTTISFDKISNVEFSAPKRVKEFLEWSFGKDDWKKHMSGSEYMKYIHTYDIHKKRAAIERFREMMQNGELDATTLWKK